MPKPKVFATHSLFDAARQILQKSCEVQYWTKPERPPREEVLQQVKEKEGLICLLTEKVDEDLLREAPNLRIAANVGWDLTISTWPRARSEVWRRRTRRA